MRRRRLADAFDLEWGDLATYNAEVARGIVHTPEYDKKMARKQAEYNERVLMKGLGFPPGTVVKTKRLP